jgi:hypothetical protein
MTDDSDSRFSRRYRLPAVRHLDWMCHAPALVDSPKGFRPSDFLPRNLNHRLEEWDQRPETGPAVLTADPARRLGHYFESLYECLLTDILGWEVLARNLPVRSEGITLGELDFIVRNPADGSVEHHEIAVKFYLGYQGEGMDAPLWYGPNSKDRLDLKSRRLLSHQSRMTDRPETRALLESLEIPVPARARVFMPGYLFYPIGQTLPAPPGVPSDHLRGEWIYSGQLDAGTQFWVPLVKPHWLGPWTQAQAPDGQAATEALEMVRTANVPRLFARLAQCPEDGQWHETSRLFVVPDNWP